MPSERSERPERSDRETRSSSRKSKEKPSTAEKVESAKAQGKEALEKAKEAASQASDAIAPVLDTVVAAVGGWDELDRTIRNHNPTIADYAEKSFLNKLSISNSPAKFVLFLILLGIVQSILPVFAWPLDFLSRLLAFLFLYNSGIAALSAGFNSSRSLQQVKSLLTVLFIVSAIQLLPSFLFDTTYHFGALWAFFLPALLFVTPEKRGPTVAEMISDTLFSQIGEVFSSVMPVELEGENGNYLQMLGGIGVALLFWVGYLGSAGSYVVSWSFLAFQTVNILSQKTRSKDDPKKYEAQQTIIHNVLAIWLWRYLLTAIESVQIPGLLSVPGLILHYIPSYFLWMTGFMFAMLLTKKTSEKMKANTWYAKWLLGGFGGKKKSSSRSEGGSSSRSEGSSRDSRERSSRPSGSSSGSGSRESRSSSDKSKSSRDAKK